MKTSIRGFNMFKKLGLVLALLCMAQPAMAAVTGNNPITAQLPMNGLVQFLQGTDAAGTYKTLYTAGTNGSKISGIFVTSNDASVAHLVTCQIVNTAVKYGGVSATIAVNLGFANAAAPFNLMSQTIWPGLPIDMNGNPYFYLKSGDTLQCTFATALTTSDVLNLIAIASDY